MKTIYRKSLGLALTLFIFTGLTYAQVLKPNAKSFITINGTSNLHDWQSKTQQVNGQIAVNFETNQIQSMVIEVPAKSIKSKEKLMDTKTYEALNADKYSTIQFKLTEVNNTEIKDNLINVTVSGNLTIAGTTRKIAVKTTGKSLGAGTYAFTGTIGLKMSDFKIAPPTAMLGMLKVGDAVTLRFEIVVDGIQLKK